MPFQFLSEIFRFSGKTTDVSDNDFIEIVVTSGEDVTGYNITMYRGNTAAAVDVEFTLGSLPANVTLM